MIVSDVVIKNMPSPGMLVTIVKTDAVVDISAVVMIICALGVVIMKNVTILVMVAQYVKAAKSIIISVADITDILTSSRYDGWCILRYFNSFLGNIIDIIEDTQQVIKIIAVLKMMSAVTTNMTSLLVSLL
ncbi:12874_t:CDS:2 [Acaulospora colombiana]|uniref:12874_t:CDS:1 n=1 Tax=Acaulospora colombiana TaxID=27376 RepID=A0ACA9LMG4_9GLOM|nr:12874_t:CDS:2 [Acaulospora colombiana]